MGCQLKSSGAELQRTQTAAAPMWSQLETELQRTQAVQGSSWNMARLELGVTRPLESPGLCPLVGMQVDRPDSVRAVDESSARLEECHHWWPRQGGGPSVEPRFLPGAPGSAAAGASGDAPRGQGRLRGGPSRRAAPQEAHGRPSRCISNPQAEQEAEFWAMIRRS